MSKDTLNDDAIADASNNDQVMLTKRIANGNAVEDAISKGGGGEFDLSYSLGNVRVTPRNIGGSGVVLPCRASVAKNFDPMAVQAETKSRKLFHLIMVDALAASEEHSALVTMSALRSIDEEM